MLTAGPVQATGQRLTPCHQGHSHQRALRAAPGSAAAPARSFSGPLPSQQPHRPGAPRPGPLLPLRPRLRPPASTPPLDVQVIEVSEDPSAVAEAAVTPVGEDNAVDVSVDIVDVVGADGDVAAVAAAAELASAASGGPIAGEDGSLEGGAAGRLLELARTERDGAAAAPPAGPPGAAAQVAATPSPSSPLTEPLESSGAPPPPSPSPSPPSPLPPPPLRRAPAVDLPLAELVNGGSTATPRPFPPPLDLQRLSDALLGEPTIGPIFNELFQLSRNRQPATTTADPASPASTGPLLYAPRFPRPPGSPPASSLPLLVYLPGIDGTGLAAYRQFPGLAARFELRGLFLPPEDRTSFHGLVESLAQQLEDELSPLEPSRPVYLMGESFGGLLALQLAQRVSFVDRIILVNPATSFDRSPWPSLGPLLPALPPDLYRLLPVALAPVLSNPLAMASWSASPSDSLPQRAANIANGLIELLPQLSSLRVVLPPETLAWRLQLLREGAELVNRTLGKVRQRTLLLVGEADLVIPSASEAPRLEAALPRCRARVVAGGSHALLQQAGVDLAEIIREEDFYVPRRRLTRPNVPPPRPAKPAPGGANFGSPGPLELPTPGEVRRGLEAAGLTSLRRLVSPVFLSTDAASGRVGLGLGGLPAPGSGPVLFVGNHQLFAPDMPLMVGHFLEERGQLLRGLAHPTALGMRAEGSSGGAGPAAMRPSTSRFGRFLETFGAVPVSGRNLYALLQGGEAALLYPGGVREALKLRGEQYELIWPRRAEFVRMACKLGATIVPFAAVGAEDCVELLLDRRDLQAAPLLGPWLRQQEGSLMRARRGVTESEDVEESFIAPIAAFKPPARFYFLFGAPITTDPRVAGDRAAVAQLYGRVRSDVEGCRDYLLRKREQDPYRELGPRLLYEAAWGGRRQAPTFEP